MKTILTALNLALLLATLSAAWADKPAPQPQPPAARLLPAAPQDPAPRPHPNAQPHTCHPAAVAACNNDLGNCNITCEAVQAADKNSCLEQCRTVWKSCTEKHIC